MKRIPDDRPTAPSVAEYAKLIAQEQDEACETALRELEAEAGRLAAEAYDP